MKHFGKITSAFLKSNDYKLFDRVQKSRKQFTGKVLIENGEDPREYENIDSCLSDILLSSKEDLMFRDIRGLVK